MPAVARRTAADEARGAAMSTAELEAELDALLLLVITYSMKTLCNSD
jgi:hypothetical protein